VPSSAAYIFLCSLFTGWRIISLFFTTQCCMFELILQNIKKLQDCKKCATDAFLEM
jgi:hypothetical protein